MIYLASPYTSALPNKEGIKIMQLRYEAVMDFVASNLSEQFFSPILYTHEMAKKHELPKTFGYWKEVNHHYIDISTEVCILMIEGWSDSKGVRDEIEYAERTGKKVKYIKGENYDL